MKGKVLGFSAKTGEGAITSEDGDRYKFTKADWLGEEEPQAGMEVDFVAADGKATEIYGVKKSVSMPSMPNFSGGSGGSAPPALDWTLARPAFIGAVLAIVGWLAIGGLVILGQVSDASSAIGDMNRVARQFGAGSGSTVFIQLGLYVLILFYVIPVAAGFHIYQSVTGRETAMVRLAAGVAAAGLPIVLPILSGTLIMMGLPDGVRDFTRALGGDDFTANSLSLGSFLIIAGGVLILLTHFGVLKSFKKTADA